MISKDQTKHIADLARINMTESELEKTSEELSVVLDYFKQLEEVDTSGVDLALGGSDSLNVFREDDDILCSDENLLNNLLKEAPLSEDGYIKVKSILK